jgi:hypothetical protein
VVHPQAGLKFLQYLLELQENYYQTIAYKTEKLCDCFRTIPTDALPEEADKKDGEEHVLGPEMDAASELDHLVHCLTVSGQL